MATSSCLNTEIRDGYLWVTPLDTIDMDNTRLIEDRFHTAFDSHPCAVVLDMAATHALFSSGIGLIMRLYNIAKEAGRDFRVVNVEKKIFDAMESMGLARVLAIHIAGTPLEL